MIVEGGPNGFNGAQTRFPEGVLERERRRIRIRPGGKQIGPKTTDLQRMEYSVGEAGESSMRRIAVMAVMPWAGALALFLALSLPSRSAELEVQSKVDSVAVSPDAATVTRVAEVDLGAGDLTLVFKNLPFSLDPASLRLA